MSELAHESTIRYVINSKPPSPKNKARDRAMKLKFDERFKNMYTPFIEFGDVDYYRYYSTPLKFKIPVI